jgi:hypothetical protein
VHRLTPVTIAVAVVLIAAATGSKAAPTIARALATPTVRIAISGAGHRPAAGRKWSFAVHAFTQAGHPLTGTVIVRVRVGNRVVDTLGWFAFAGNLRRSYLWPQALAGSTAALTITVLTGRTSYARSYPIRVADTSGNPRFRATLAATTRAPLPGKPWRYRLRIYGTHPGSLDATAIIRTVSGNHILDTVGWFATRGQLEGVYRWPHQLHRQAAALQAVVIGPGGTRTITYHLHIR